MSVETPEQRTLLALADRYYQASVRHPDHPDARDMHVLSVHLTLAANALASSDTRLPWADLLDREPRAAD